MKKTRILSVILCLAVVFSMCQMFAFAAEDGFKDVSEKDWFCDDVAYVVENGLFKGETSTTFAPNKGMDRGMIATVLYRLAGNPEVEEAASFDDVAADAYYAPAVAWAKKAGVINGTSDKTFSPKDLVTREQIVSLMYRFYTEYKGVGAANAAELKDYSDAASVAAFAVDAMKWAVGNGIINGSDGKLDPKGTATRAQVAAIIARFAKFAEAEAEAARRAGIRIVCMAPSMVECVYALGYGDCIVGWSAYTDYPVAAQETTGYLPYQYYYDINTPDFDVDMELGKKDCVDLEGNVLEGVRKQVATVSKFYDYNEEILDGLNATVIFCEGTEQADWGEYLNNEKGIPTYCYTPESIDDIYDMMIEMGEILGCKEYAQELVDGYYARIDEIKDITKDLAPIRTYFEIAHQSDYGEWGKYGPYTEGGNTPFDEMIRIAGGVNIFNDQKDYVNLYDVFGDDCFPETVKRDPQVIMSPYWPGAYDFEVTTLYEIMTRPGFNETQAVQTGRVCYYDSSLMKRFGPRTIKAIEKLAYLLHPYYFPNPENSVSPWELGKIDVAEYFPAPLD